MVVRDCADIAISPDDFKLSSAAFRVWIALSLMVDSTTGQELTYAEITRITGFERKLIAKAVSELSQRGYISVARLPHGIWYTINRA